MKKIKIEAKNVKFSFPYYLEAGIYFILTSSKKEDYEIFCIVMENEKEIEKIRFDDYASGFELFEEGGSKKAYFELEFDSYGGNGNAAMILFRKRREKNKEIVFEITAKIEDPWFLFEESEEDGFLPDDDIGDSFDVENWYEE